MSRYDANILRPLGPWTINHQSPQGKNLVAWWSGVYPGGNLDVDLVNGQGAFTLANLDWGFIPGLGSAPNITSTSNALQVGRNSLHTFDRDFTVSAWIFITGGGGTARAIISRGDSE